MSHTHSTTKRRTFKHLNAYQRGQIEAMLRLGVPKVKIAKDLEQLHGDVVVDRLRTDLNIEQVHPFGTTTDRVRCIFVLYDTGFYILDELLCRMEFRRFFAVLTMPLILDLPRLGEILFMGGDKLECFCTTVPRFISSYKVERAMPRLLAISDLGTPRRNCA